MSKMLVIGVGNIFRGDDGVGLVVARRVREAAPPDVVVLEQSGEGAALMEAWREAEFVILVDAVSSGAEPGTIHHFAAHQQTIPARFFHYSTHAFSVAEAVEMARALGSLPPRLLLYGIEGKSFAAGQELSPEIAQAAEVVTAQILALFA
ncbi:MAG: hydrogenase maturation protease [Chloroflexi bacterium]|nr:hydrogenase maturation protease [Chloroflexota bacterium]